jgi:hypothetical protein
MEMETMKTDISRFMRVPLYVLTSIFFVACERCFSIAFTTPFTAGWNKAAISLL